MWILPGCIGRDTLWPIKHRPWPLDSPTCLFFRWDWRLSCPSLNICKFTVETMAWFCMDFMDVYTHVQNWNTGVYSSACFFILTGGISSHPPHVPGGGGDHLYAFLAIENLSKVITWQLRLQWILGQSTIKIACCQIQSKFGAQNEKDFDWAQKDFKKIIQFNQAHMKFYFRLFPFFQFLGKLNFINLLQMEANGIWYVGFCFCFCFFLVCVLLEWPNKPYTFWQLFFLFLKRLVASFWENGDNIFCNSQPITQLNMR